MIAKLAVSARAFSDAIEDSPTNTQNYIGPRQTAPKHEYLAKVVRHFSTVNAQWLLTGEGEPFIGDAPTPPNTVNTKKNRGNSIGINHGTANQNSYTIADCEKERDTYRQERDHARQEAESLRAQMTLQANLIAAKDETITLLRGGYNRPT